MTEDERMRRAREVFDQIYYGLIDGPEAELEPGSYSALNMGLIADTWGNPQLTMREKRLVVLSLLIGAGADPSLFLLHARCALAGNELSAADIRQIFNFGVFYAGVKSTSLPFQRFEEMLRKLEVAG